MTMDSSTSRRSAAAGTALCGRVSWLRLALRLKAEEGSPIAMFKNILVPLDGSALAARALPFAKRLARAGGARLIVVRAHLPADDGLSVRLAYPAFSAAKRADLDCKTAKAQLQSAVDALRQDG